MAKKFNWENSEIFNINKEDGHAIAMPYDSKEEIYEGDESKYKMSLNGNWKFKWQRGIDNQPEGFQRPDFSDKDWDDIKVPSVWQTEGYSVPYYYASTFPRAISRSKNKIPKIDHSMQEIGFYRRTFTYQSIFKNREVFIHFGAAKSALELYINGESVGYSQGSMTPHEFNITSYLTAGENTIAVKLYRYSDGTYLEDQDMWWLCGIYRDVYLYAESKVSIFDFYFKTDFGNDFSSSDVTLHGYIKNYTSLKNKVVFEASLADQYGKEISLGRVSTDVDAGETADIVMQKTVDSPELWSAEHPNLYVLMMSAYVGKKLVEVKSYFVGFKKVEIKGEQIYFNGMPLFINGVNRHDFDPDCGWAVPKRRYKQDLDIMKQSNINAIRTSHYPDDPYFYDMCNMYGFYVMDECELESHGVRRKGVPGSNPKWTGAAVDRMVRMVLRDRNNPCIFMWSLGNEAGDGDNFKFMKEAALKLDDTRQFHYEGDFDLTKSDVISRMYPTADIMEKLGNKEPISISFYENVANQLAADSKPLSREMYEGKPIILCEYAHSMENSLGNFKEYMDDFEKYDNMCGGFIWDFVDQSLRRRDSEGNDLWLYGSDFATKEPKHLFSPINTTAIGGSNTYLCANGIVAANRQIHPQIYEVKKVYAHIKTTAVNLESGTFKVKNKMLFTNVNEYDCKWKITAEGRPIMHGELAELDCAPLSEVSVSIPYTTDEIQKNKEVVLTISFCAKKSSYGIKKGYEVAWDQFVLNEMPQPVRPNDNGDLNFRKKGNKLTVEGRNFVLSINSGKITSYVYKDKELLRGAVRPNYFRALTDNDIDFYNFVPPIIRFNPYYKWQHATKHTKAVKTVAKADEDNSLKISIAMKTPGLTNSVITYKVYPSGKVYVFHSAVPKKDMVRFGFEMTLNGNMDHVTWYGRGPFPTYSDRKTGAKIGVYSSKVSDLDHKYMRPQESSNRTDVRYMQINDDDGYGLKFTSYYNDPINFSAYHYTTEALEKATHIHKLIKDFRITTLNIDHRQCGVGGDMPAQACVREPYIMKKGEKESFSFIIEPLSAK